MGTIISAMVLCTYFLTSTNSSANKIIEALRSVVNPLQFNKNCLKTGVWQNADDPNSIMVLEIWKNMPELEKYLQSSHYKRMIEVIEMSAEKPEIRFIDSEMALGLEWLEKIIVA